MMKISKKLLCILTILCIIGSCTVCFAEKVEDVEIDSNTWTPFLTINKINARSIIFKIDKVYKGAGGYDPDNYKKVKITVDVNGVQEFYGTCSEGKTYIINFDTLTEAEVIFSAMGNDSSLDCYIEGSFNVND
ncbi:hypothetical protein [Wukongibacter sp. M2B1]|uniref:hypothetical protein n=1 Tax=Wukongibacter sp. M2B1 TaxID=3088895 RepID=UPI003D7AA229